MIILLNILFFLLLVCGVSYLAICRVLTKDLEKVGSMNHAEYRRDDLLVCRRRNLKFAASMFLTALLTNFVMSFILRGWNPGHFGLFLVSSDIAIVLTGVIDIIENATYLHRYVHVRLSAGIAYAAFLSWIVAVFFFFYWLPLVAFVLTFSISIVLLVVYKKRK